MRTLVMVVLLFVAAVAAKADIPVHPLNVPFSVRIDTKKPLPIGPILMVPTQQTLPGFPIGMRLALASGEVAVAFTIEADGSMTKVKILKHSKKEFDDAVLEALKLWRFGPALEGGKSVRAPFEYVVRFSIGYESTEPNQSLQPTAPSRSG